MTQRRQLLKRADGLRESGEIIRGLKNLAYMETRKLNRLVEQQRGVAARIVEIATDLLSFHPELRTADMPVHPVFLVVGSRRGFCGDFNERLIAELDQLSAPGTLHGVANATIITVGRKLGVRLQQKSRPAVPIEGADVAEEIPLVLSAIVGALDEQRRQHGGLALQALYHPAEVEDLHLVRLLPPFQRNGNPAQRHPCAPAINLSPEQLLLEMGEQYLFAGLQAILCESLLAENQRRVRHLEGAVHHLEERLLSLQRRLQALRQEEIVEEIEVILLNADPQGTSSTGDESRAGVRRHRLAEGANPALPEQ